MWCYPQLIWCSVHCLPVLETTRTTHCEFSCFIMRCKIFLSVEPLCSIWIQRAKGNLERGGLWSRIHLCRNIKGFFFQNQTVLKRSSIWWEWSFTWDVVWERIGKAGSYATHHQGTLGQCLFSSLSRCGLILASTVELVHVSWHSLKKKVQMGNESANLPPKSAYTGKKASATVFFLEI